MSSSPKEPIGSPTRYHNRYSERYKSLLTESPPRELKTPEKPTYSNLKNSPLQSNRYNEHTLSEGEKYTTLKIKNEDRGEWRESNLFNEENLDEVERVQVTKPQQQQQQQVATIKTIEQEVSYTKISSPIKSPNNHNNNNTIEPPVKEEHKPLSQHSHSHRRGIPHYMQATSSFETRVNHTKERRSQSDILGRRSKGGISKRVGTTKVPRYQATTTINAIEDIQNEMQPEDTYVPMAARIKLFEKGLGNGSNKPAPIVRQSSSTSSSSQPKQSSQSKQRPPSRSSSTRLSPSTSSLPGYARNTIASGTKEASRKLIRENTEKSTRMDRSKSFTTSERNQEPSFNEKLNLWKGKDKIATMESYNKNRGLKRKNEHTTTTNIRKHHKK